MAAQKTSYGVVNKRRAKKRQSRTEVSSSSESDSDSDVSSKKSRSSSEDVASKDSSPIPASTPVSAKKTQPSKPVQDASTDSEESSPAPAPSTTVKKSKKKSKSSSNEDVTMTDAPAPASAPASKKTKTPSHPTEDFSAIYLRKIAAEVADDLDKVREAQDFKANSVPMLIHALKQGESMFSAEEKRRVVGAAAGQ